MTGPITSAVVNDCLPDTKSMYPIVLAHVVDGLNDLVKQLASVWIQAGDIRETRCGLLLADQHGHDARIMHREQCVLEALANGLPSEHCDAILGSLPPEMFMVVIVTDRACIVFGLPVTMTRIKPAGSENN